MSTRSFMCFIIIFRTARRRTDPNVIITIILIIVASIKRAMKKKKKLIIKYITVHYINKSSCANRFPPGEGPGRRVLNSFFKKPTVSIGYKRRLERQVFKILRGGSLFLDIFIQLIRFEQNKIKKSPVKIDVDRQNVMAHKY